MTGNVAAIVLAGGSASRAGGPKQTWLVGGRSSVARVAEAALASPLVARVIVVTGAWAEEVRAALQKPKLPVEIVHNPRYAEGQAESLKAGLRALDEKCAAVLFLLADQPLIDSAIISKVIQYYLDTGAKIAAPVYEGRRRNPTLFDLARFRDELMALTGDQGGRKLLERYADELELVDCGGTAKTFDDFDCESEYEAFKNVAETHN